MMRVIPRDHSLAGDIIGPDCDDGGYEADRTAVAAVLLGVGSVHFGVLSIETLHALP